MTWPVFFYLPRPDAASSALSALQDILISLACRFVYRIIRYESLAAGAYRICWKGSILGLRAGTHGRFQKPGLPRLRFEQFGDARGIAKYGNSTFLM
jgi:hypothetical protein